jgi:hypothetical protein
VPLPHPNESGQTVNRSLLRENRPLVRNVLCAHSHEGEQQLGLTALLPPGRDDPFALMHEGAGMQQHVSLPEQLQADEGLQQRDRLHSPLAHHLASPAERGEVDPCPAPDCVQEVEAVIVESCFVQTEKAKITCSREGVDEADMDIRLVCNRPLRGPEEPLDLTDDCVRRPHQPDRHQAVRGVVDDPARGAVVQRRRGPSPRRRDAVPVAGEGVRGKSDPAAASAD